MGRLGPVLVDALLSIPPANIDGKAGAGICDASLSISPADDNERLGPVLVTLRSRYRQRMMMRGWGRYWWMLCSRYRQRGCDW